MLQTKFPIMTRRIRYFILPIVTTLKVFSGEFSVFLDSIYVDEFAKDIYRVYPGCLSILQYNICPDSGLKLDHCPALKTLRQHYIAKLVKRRAFCGWLCRFRR